MRRLFLEFWVVLAGLRVHKMALGQVLFGVLLLPLTVLIFLCSLFILIHPPLTLHLHNNYSPTK
jgi:hypothetical protein